MSFPPDSISGEFAGPISAAGAAEGKHIVVLDGWRGLAIFAVLFGHFVPGFGVDARLGINTGRLGVDLFFVLSGLLMGRILFVKRLSIVLFYKRRISRIFPALIAYVAASTAFLVVIRHEYPWKSLLSIASLTLNYYFGHSHGRVPDEYQHLWSICIEEHGYLLLGGVALLTARWSAAPYRIIAPLALASWAMAAIYSQFTDWKYYEIFWRSEARLGGILGSAALAVWLAERRRPLFSGVPVAAFLALGFLLETNHVPDLVKYTFGTLCLSLAVTHIQYAPRLLVKLFESPILVRLGLLSYSIYLWQQPFYAYYDHHPAFRYPALLCAVVAGLASFTLLENPARTWLNAHWARPRPRRI